MGSWSSIAHTPSSETIDVGGEIVVQCLEGQVAITDSTQTQKLHAREWLYLPAGEPHSVKSVEPASLLLSIQTP
jgi:quercetin dioxygenase-like cupin family protein